MAARAASRTRLVQTRKRSEPPRLLRGCSRSPDDRHPLAVEILEMPASREYLTLAVRQWSATEVQEPLEFTGIGVRSSVSPHLVAVPGDRSRQLGRRGHHPSGAGRSSRAPSPIR